MSWQIINNKLHKEFELKNFREAIDFMNKCVPAIESLNHHPEWKNVYNKVIIDLITHSEGEVADKDRELAEKIDKIYEGA